VSSRNCLRHGARLRTVPYEKPGTGSDDYQCERLDGRQIVWLLSLWGNGAVTRLLRGRGVGGQLGL
jgi:hypothetical protein